jgi:DNA uptake protein ComE-like DNA-binding protein
MTWSRQGVIAFVLSGLAVFSASAQSGTPPVDMDVNVATRAQLEQLRGVGVRLADRILQERTVQAFHDWEDFQRRVPVSRRHVEGWRRDGVTIGPVGKDRSATEAVQNR